MRIPIVIVLGKAFYIKKYSKFLEKHNPKAKLLVIDKSKKKIDLPENAEYLCVSTKNSLSKIVLFCIEHKYSVIGVINRVDYFEVLHGQLAETFNIPGPSAASVLALSDKVRMHELMIQNDLSFYRPRTIVTTLDEVPDYFDQLQFPVILKTSVGAKSRGVVTIKSAGEFAQAKEIVVENMLDSKNDLVLIEQFIYGQQVAPVMYVNNKGKVRILALVDVITAREEKQNNMQLIYRTTPSKHSERIRQKITYVMQTLVDASGLKSVLLHPEFFVTGKHIFLIEVNVRIGGFRETMMSNAYNIDLSKLSWELAMDLNTSDQLKSSNSSTACEVWEPKSGKLSRLSIPSSKYVSQKKYYMKPGDKYIAPPLAQKPLALFYVTAPDDSLSIARKIRKKTVIEFV